MAKTNLRLVRPHKRRWLRNAGAMNQPPGAFRHATEFFLEIFPGKPVRHLRNSFPDGVFIGCEICAFRSGFALVRNVDGAATAVSGGQYASISAARVDFE